MGRGGARQLVHAIEDCEASQLDQHLAEASAKFPGLAERALGVVVHDHGFGLSAAYDKLSAAGFRMGHAQLSTEVPSSRNLGTISAQNNRSAAHLRTSALDPSAGGYGSTGDVAATRG